MHACKEYISSHRAQDEEGGGEEDSEAEESDREYVWEVGFEDFHKFSFLFLST